MRCQGAAGGLLVDRWSMLLPALWNARLLVRPMGSPWYHSLRPLAAAGTTACRSMSDVQPEKWPVVWAVEVQP